MDDGFPFDGKVMNIYFIRVYIIQLFFLFLELVNLMEDISVARNRYFGILISFLNIICNFINLKHRICNFNILYLKI